MRAKGSFAVGFGMLGALALVLLWTAPAEAYSTYGGGCDTCHGGWDMGVPLHDLHQSNMLNGDCSTCHTGGPGNVDLDQSDGGDGLDPISCLGCHGRAEPDEGGAVTAAGLRQHHFNNGQDCAPCHSDDQDPALFMTAGEDVLPPYYANPGTGHNIPDDPCNPPPGFPEDYTADDIGLDNDGDNIYDAVDPDCAAPTPTPTPPVGPTPTAVPATPTPPVGPTPTPPVGPTATPAPATPTPPVGPTATPAPATPTPAPTPTPGPGPLDKDQQKCVKAMNKAGQKVEKAQLKENETCLKDYQKGKLVGSVEDCTTADLKGKVQKAEEKTVADDQKNCVPLNPAPAFAYTSAATVNAAAVEGALDLIHIIFGDPVDDADLYLKEAPTKDSAKCQETMLKEANKLEDNIVKQVVKTKKKTIKDPSVNSAAALGAELALVFDDEKILKNEGKLVDTVDKKCIGGVVNTPQELFPGACVDDQLANVETCVVAAARCLACLKINAFDDLTMDCDLGDNNAADGSCPLP